MASPTRWARSPSKRSRCDVRNRSIARETSAPGYRSIAQPASDSIGCSASATSVRRARSESRNEPPSPPHGEPQSSPPFCGWKRPPGRAARGIPGTPPARGRSRAGGRPGSRRRAESPPGLPGAELISSSVDDARSIKSGSPASPYAARSRNSSTAPARANRSGSSQSAGRNATMSAFERSWRSRELAIDDGGDGDARLERRPEAALGTARSFATQRAARTRA